MTELDTLRDMGLATTRRKVFMEADLPAIVARMEELEAKNRQLPEALTNQREAEDQYTKACVTIANMAVRLEELEAGNKKLREALERVAVGIEGECDCGKWRASCHQDDPGGDNWDGPHKPTCIQVVIPQALKEEEG